MIKYRLNEYSFLAIILVILLCIALLVVLYENLTHNRILELHTVAQVFIGILVLYIFMNNMTFPLYIVLLTLLILMFH